MALTPPVVLAKLAKGQRPSSITNSSIHSSTSRHSRFKSSPEGFNSYYQESILMKYLISNNANKNLISIKKLSVAIYEPH
jgi:hypothetical protein